MRTRSDEARGSVSAMVVSLAAALVFLSGVVHDTGRLVETHARLSDVAGNVARVSAQSVRGIRSGSPEIDSHGGRQRGTAMLRTEGVSGRITVAAGRVQVEVHERVSFVALVLLGIPAREITVTRSAAVMSG